METWYDYKLYEDNGGCYYLFVRDFGGPQLHNVAPVLYCFTSGKRDELINALGEIMSNPEDANLDEWSGWGDCDDPESLLMELENLVNERNGGALLVLEGDIYK